LLEARGKLRGRQGRIKIEEKIKMKIKIRFEGRTLFLSLAARISSRVPREGYWKQEFSIERDTLTLRNLAGKGSWKVETKGKDTVVSFKGYRNSFSNGTCAFDTSMLPWAEAEVIHVQTSAPEKPILVDLGEDRYLKLPFEGTDFEEISVRPDEAGLPHSRQSRREGRRYR